MAGEILCDLPAQHESDSGSGREYPMWLDGRGRRRQAQQFRGGPKLRTPRDAREALRAEEGGEWRGESCVPTTITGARS